MTNGEGGMVMVPVTLLERCVMWFNTLANYGMDAAFSDGERTPNARAMDELASQISTLLADNALAAAPSAQPNAAHDWKNCIHSECRINGRCGWPVDCHAPASPKRRPRLCPCTFEHMPHDDCDGSPAGVAPSTGNEGLAADVVAMCKKRGWSMHWTHRGAYLHLESSELIEAIRGKHGDPMKEAADVLLVLMSITEYAGIPWSDVLRQARAKCDELMVKPHYAGEEYSESGRGEMSMDLDATKGLYCKFNVTRTDGSSKRGGKHEHCEYYVLDLNHDRHAIPALEAYAKACQSEYPQLADDLLDKVALLKPALASPVAKIEEPKEFAQVRASKAQTYFQEVAIAYVDSLRAALEEAERERDKLRDVVIEAGARVANAQSALAAVKEKVERETIERCAIECDAVVARHRETEASFRQSPPRKIPERDARQRASGAMDCSHAIRALQSSGDKT